MSRLGPAAPVANKPPVRKARRRPAAKASPTHPPVPDNSMRQPVRARVRKAVGAPRADGTRATKVVVRSFPSVAHYEAHQRRVGEAAAGKAADRQQLRADVRHDQVARSSAPLRRIRLAAGERQIRLKARRAAAVTKRSDDREIARFGQVHPHTGTADRSTTQERRYDQAVRAEARKADAPLVAQARHLAPDVRHDLEHGVATAAAKGMYTAAARHSARLATSRATAAARLQARRSEPTVANVAHNLAADVKDAVSNPVPVIKTFAAAGRELAHEAVARPAGHRVTRDMPKTDRLVHELAASSPTVALVQGHPAEAARRAVAHPLSVTEALPAVGAAGKLANVARYGRGAQGAARLAKARRRADVVVKVGFDSAKDIHVQRVYRADPVARGAQKAKDAAVRRVRGERAHTTKVGRVPLTKGRRVARRKLRRDASLVKNRNIAREEAIARGEHVDQPAPATLKAHRRARKTARQLAKGLASDRHLRTLVTDAYHGGIHVDSHDVAHATLKRRVATLEAEHGSGRLAGREQRRAEQDAARNGASRDQAAKAGRDARARYEDGQKQTIAALRDAQRHATPERVAAARDYVEHFTELGKAQDARQVALRGLDETGAKLRHNIAHAIAQGRIVHRDAGETIHVREHVDDVRVAELEQRAASAQQHASVTAHQLRNEAVDEAQHGQRRRAHQAALDRLATARDELAQARTPAGRTHRVERGGFYDQAGKRVDPAALPDVSAKHGYARYGNEDHPHDRAIGTPTIGKGFTGHELMGAHLDELHPARQQVAVERALGTATLAHKLLEHAVTGPAGTMRKEVAQRAAAAQQAASGTRWVAVEAHHVPVGQGRHFYTEGGGEMPGRGEQGYVAMPAHVAQHWRHQMAQPGRALAAAQGATRTFVRAVLPLSATWHAGNVADMATRLATSGWRPGDHAAGEHLAAQLQELDPALRSLVMDSFSAHAGQRVTVEKRGITDVVKGRELRVPEGGRLPRLADKGPDARATRAGVRIAGAASKGAQRSGLRAVSHGIDRVLDFSADIEQQMSRAAYGTVARQLLAEQADHLHTIADLAKHLQTSERARDRFAELTLQITGDYLTRGPKGRGWAHVAMPFLSWLKASNRYVWRTLPANHPVKVALYLQAARASERDRRTMGMSDWISPAEAQALGLPKPAQGYLGGALPVGVKGDVLPTSFLSSFGEAAALAEDPLDQLARHVLPQASQVAAAAQGHKGGEVRYRERQYASQAGLRGEGTRGLGGGDPRVAARKLAEVTIPGAKQVGGIFGEANATEDGSGGILGTVDPGVSGRSTGERVFKGATGFGRTRDFPEKTPVDVEGHVHPGDQGEVLFDELANRYVRGQSGGRDAQSAARHEDPTDRGNRQVRRVAKLLRAGAIASHPNTSDEALAASGATRAVPIAKMAPGASRDAQVRQAVPALRRELARATGAEKRRLAAELAGLQAIAPKRRRARKRSGP